MMVTRKPLSRNLRVLALMLLAVALLVGCGSGPASGAATPGATPHASVSVTPQPPMPTTLQIVRWAPPEARVAPFSAQTNDAVKVQRLFATLRALPTYMPAFSCPQGHGGGYLLTFLDHDQVVAVAGIAVSGCQQVDLSEPYGCHRLTATTMDQVAETLGVPPATVGTGSDFYDTAAPGSPLATADPYVPPVSFTPCH
jgi:hypothetical protein